MKLNISYPVAGTQKCIEIDDDKKYSLFFDRRMGQEVEADQLGDEFKGYILKITGGNDKQGFSMKQGVLVKGRVRLLMSKGHKTYRPRRTGERKRKSVRGCIVGSDIAVLALAVMRKGEQDIADLTDKANPRRLGPKRVSNIRKLFALKKTDDVVLVKKNVIRRSFKSESGKDRQKAPRIQRLVTEKRLLRKAQYKKAKKDNWTKGRQARDTYKALLGELRKKKIQK